VNIEITKGIEFCIKVRNFTARVPVLFSKFKVEETEERLFRSIELKTMRFATSFIVFVRSLFVSCIAYLLSLWRSLIARKLMGVA